MTRPLPPVARAAVSHGRPLAVALAACVLGVLQAVPDAVAQPEICARPARPDIPAGDSAEFDTLAAARETVDTYLDRMQDYLDCLQEESTAASAETGRVVDQWNEAARAFEARQQQ